MRWNAIGILCLFLLSGGLAARDRSAAREAYRAANEYYQWFMDQPAGNRSHEQYQRSIFLYRKVIDHDPTYSACDDAIFRIAGLYEEMAERFSSERYRLRALYYYDFVVREYPTTPMKESAQSRADALRKPPPPDPIPPRPAATETPVEPAAHRDEPSRVSASPPPEDSELATLSEVRYWSNEDYTRVVLQLDEEVSFTKSILLNPDRIYFDLENARIDSDVNERQYDVNGLFIQRIRVAENRPGVIRVVLDFDQINQHTVFALYDPFRIVIDTRGKPKVVSDGGQAQPGETATGTSAASPAGPVETRTTTRSAESSAPAPSPTIRGDWTLTRTLGLKVGRVVIDPGHGGKDTGTIGPTGLREKDLVLKVALELKTLLETRLGTEVILTRDDDRFVPLEERTAIANQENADLFISIHANASRNQRVSGIETYVLDFATDSGEREVASRENASAQRTIGELEDLLKQIALGDYNEESRDLAHVVQKELVTEINSHRPGQRDRGVKQAPFIVLIGSMMPSILTEIGFISNPKDELYFKKEEAFTHVAEALYRGVEGYFRSLGTLPNLQRAASAGGR